MLVLITYDVDTETSIGKRRLVKIAKICCDYGQRVQKSVFECDLEADQYVFVKNALLGIMDSKKDSIRFYNLGNKYKQKIEEFGCKHSYDPEDVMIV